MNASDNDHLVRSYRGLRKSIGVLGVILPVVLPAGVAVFGTKAVFQNSISDYYGTVMIAVFVGVLFAIGVFLFSYKGHETADNIAGNLACVFALGVAIFPTTSEHKLVRVIHFTSAAALFITLAYFSYFLFTRTRPGTTPSRKRQRRNTVYRTCAWIIVACIVAIPLYNTFLSDTSLADLKPVFVLESVALWAFGWAWFLKGRGIEAIKQKLTRSKAVAEVSQ